MKHAAGAWFEWLHEWIEVERYVDESKLTEISGDGMNPKKLTQAVFEGLPVEYRWAAVDEDGETYAHAVKPECHFYSGRWVQPIIRGSLALFGGDHDATDWQNSLIERRDVPTADKPESIADVARSIEAARIEEQKFKVKPCPHGCVAATIEQAERTYPHYFKDVSDVDAIDLYHVARLYDITDPALFHAFKKIACAGKRGTKDQAQDVQEAIDALKRWQELNV